MSDDSVLAQSSLLRRFFEAVFSAHAPDDACAEAAEILYDLEWVLGVAVHLLDPSNKPFPAVARGIAKVDDKPLEMKPSGPFARALSGGDRGRSDGRIPPPGIVIQSPDCRVLWRFIPIRTEQKISGVLSLATSPLSAGIWRNFSQTASLLSLQLAKAIEITGAKREMTATSSGADGAISLLSKLELGAVVGGSLDLSDTSRRLLHAVLGATGLTEGAVYITNEKDQVAELVYSNMAEETPYPKVHLSAVDPIARCIRTASPIWADGDAAEENGGRQPEYCHGIFPIVHRGKVVGVVLLLGPVPKLGGNNWVQAVPTILGHISVGLANALLFREAATYAMERDQRAAEFETVLACSNDGVLVYGPDGQIHLVSTRFREWFGVRTGGFGLDTNGLLEMVVKPALVSAASLTLSEYSNDSRLIEDLTFRRVNSSRSGHAPANHDAHKPEMVRRYVMPVKTVSGEFLGKIEIFRDLTPQLEAERCREEFLSLVGHELRTPLTSLNMYVQLMRRRMNAGKSVGTDLLGKVERLSKLMAEIIDDLVDNPGLEECLKGKDGVEKDKNLAPFGPLKAPTGDVDLNILVSSIFESKRFLQSRDRLQFKPRSLPVRVVGDSTGISKAVVRLVENALRFSPADSPVEVEVTRRGDHAMVIVQDRGIGVPPDERLRIFQRGQVSSTAKDMGLAGIGVGLDVVQRVVVGHHGGQVSIEPRPGGGSIFTIAIRSASLATA